jgi:hypothetical protein
MVSVHVTSTFSTSVPRKGHIQGYPSERSERTNTVNMVNGQNE